MIRIKRIVGRQIFDARGNPTVEAEVHLDNGGVGVASVPSGASVGQYEAVELRDSFAAAYGGKGVSKAVSYINGVIAEQLVGMEIKRQAELDQIMINLDGSRNKSNLGANSILAVSLAFARAVADSESAAFFQSLAYHAAADCPTAAVIQRWAESRGKGRRDGAALSLPVPMLNIINGGQHADNSLDIQEFMIVPIGVADISKQLQVANEVSAALRRLLIENKLGVNVGDEGGFAPGITYSRDALAILRESIGEAGYEGKVKIAIDAAASEFWRDGIYRFEGAELNERQMLDFYCQLLQDYPEIISIEDPFADGDTPGWQAATAELGERVLLVGDDLFVTNSAKLQDGLREKVANAILIKPNQIGTLSETIEAIQLAQANGYTPIISHRSGETEDTSIAHLAVAVGAPYIKTGALCRGERVAKYNELLRINEILGSRAKLDNREGSSGSGDSGE